MSAPRSKFYKGTHQILRTRDGKLHYRISTKLGGEMSIFPLSLEDVLGLRDQATAILLQQDSLDLSRFNAAP